MKRVIAILLVIACTFSSFGNVQIVNAAEGFDSHAVECHEHDCSTHDGISEHIHTDELEAQASVNRLGLNIYDPFGPEDAPYDYKLVAEGNMCEYAPGFYGYVYEKLEVVDAGVLEYFDYDTKKHDLEKFVLSFASMGTKVIENLVLRNVIKGVIQGVKWVNSETSLEEIEEKLKDLAGNLYHIIIDKEFEGNQKITYQAYTYILTYKVEINGQSYTKDKRNETYWVVSNEATDTEIYEFMSSNASYDGTAEDFLAYAIGKYYTEHHADNHVYTNDCDTTCDECGQDNRTISHTYTFDCDIICDVCGEIDEERAKNHLYVNDCDTDCNVCGEAREVSKHLYYCDCDTTCNICGYIREDQGTYEGEWENISVEDTCRAYEGTCTKCGELKSTIDSTHEWSDACDTECDDCGYDRGSQCTYKYVFEYANEPSVCRRQVRQCTKCGDSVPTTYEISHVWNNSCERYCIYCNYYQGNYCTYTSSYEYLNDPTYCKRYVRICSKCGESKPTLYLFHHSWSNACDTVCDDCGYERENQCVYVSTYVNLAKLNACRMYMDSCSVCGKKEVSYDNEHSWSNACDTECNDCGYKRSDQCDWDYEWVAVKTPDTCLKYEGMCSVCGEMNTTSYDTEHAWSNACDTECDDCGYKRESQCTYTEEWVDEATPELCEKKVMTCSACGDSYIALEDTEHAWSGLCDRECNDCGYIRENQCTYTNVWQKIGTEENCGRTDIQCSVCGVIADFIHDTEHSWSNACDTVCNDCGYKRSDQCDFDYEWVAVKTKATCLKLEGMCSVCGEMNTTAFDTEHSWSNACDQTCNDCGYNRGNQCKYTESWQNVGTAGSCQVKIKQCSVCGTIAEFTYDNEHAWSGSCDRECNDCGYTRENQCSYTNVWKAVGTKANCGRIDIQCSVCGVIADFTHDTEHSWSNACDTVCDDCGYNRGSQCIFKTSYEFTATPGVCYKTIVLCSRCRKVSSTTTDYEHAWSGKCDQICNDCEYDRGNVCSYTNVWQDVGTAAICQRLDKKCSVCGVSEILSYDTAHRYSSTTDKTCNDCGYTRP